MFVFICPLTNVNHLLLWREVSVFSCVCVYVYVFSYLKSLYPHMIKIIIHTVHFVLIIVYVH